MNDDVLDASFRPGGQPPAMAGRFLGATPAIIGGLFSVLLLGGIIWGAITRMEATKVDNPETAIMDTTSRPSNSLGDYLPEETPEPEPDPEIELEPEILAPPPISEARQAKIEFQQQQKMKELQNRTLGQESSILIATTSIGTGVTNRAGEESVRQPQNTGSQAGPGTNLNAALQALAAGASADTKSDQSQKLDFLKDGDTSSWLPHTRQGDLSKLTLKTGAVIPGVLISGLNSDLPGNVIAQVSQNVYDSATGQNLLIPQGAKLYGTYDSRVSYGQNRALVVWQRIIFPDASTLELDRMQGADVSGYSGFKDKINNHYLRIFGQMFLLSAIQAAPAKISGESNTSGDDELSRIVAVNSSKMGEKLIDRNLSIQPTIRIRPGYQFLIMVNKDMLFRRVYGA